jgi:hypothetical protein
MAKREQIECGAKSIVVVIQVVRIVRGVLRISARKVGVQRYLQCEDDEDE